MRGIQLLLVSRGLFLVLTSAVLSRSKEQKDSIAIASKSFEGPELTLLKCSPWLKTLNPASISAFDGSG